MKLATLRSDSRDGHLVVVSRDLSRYVSAEGVAPTLQWALDHWSAVSSRLRELATALEAEITSGAPFDTKVACAPLPRAYEWIDGSAYINHVVLVRKARGAKPPETLETDPLVYQGGSGTFLGPTEDIPLADPAWGMDYEAEISVIVDDVPAGVSADTALSHVKLLGLVNDVSLRNLIPAELKKGFGFVTSKPPTVFGPVFVTPDELGDAWKGGRVYLPMRSWLNGERAGDPDAGEAMHFSFGDLIAHVCKTRPLTAGTIVGSGTVSNEDEAKGVSCLAERRMREIIANGSPSTPFMKVGDRIEIDMTDDSGATIFGRIDQQVVSA